MSPSFAPRPVTSVLDTIGRTPLVRLQKLVPAGHAEVWVKLEYFNPTGSYKDRMALAMIEGAERRGALAAGMTVVEFTGGSTGSSLAMVCAVKGYRFHAVSSDAFAQEKLDTMRAFGAELDVLPNGGVVTPELFPRMRARVQEILETPGTFWTDQFHNADALDGYARIGTEILDQLGGAPSAFVGAVGTAGMLMGVSRALRDTDPNARIVALEPESSPALTQGRGGTHRVEGIATGAVPPHYDRLLVTEARAVSEAEARALARRLAAEEGIFAGTSSAVNVLGALRLAAELGAGQRVVTAAVDTGLKYLAGDLFRG
jgi:cysteine synthase A